MHRIARITGHVCMNNTDDEILTTIYTNGCGVITLNRPKALNSLNLNMVRIIINILKEWRYNNNIMFIVFRGAGSRAFCAGGDIRALANPPYAAYAADFFGTEFQLDSYIHKYPKPTISLMDGIVMGGGVGVSMHGRYRIITDKTLFAMPETGIGLFPDVGGSYFLAKKCPGYLGTYIGLTGARLKAPDIMYCKLGTHYVRNDALSSLEYNLYHNTFESEQSIVALLDSLASIPTTVAPLKRARDRIDSCFSHPNVEDIFTRLDNDNDDEWARKTLDILKRKSPLSVKLAHTLIKRGRTMYKSLDEALIYEFRVAVRIVRARHESKYPLICGDFIEGVRAQIIDKDGSPQWMHQHINQVSNDTINAYLSKFAPTETNEWVSI